MTALMNDNRGDLADARRAGAEAIKAASRARALAVIGRAGERAAAVTRRPVPRRGLLLAVPVALRRMFNPEMAGDLDDTFELRIGSPGGGANACFGLAVANQQLTITNGPAPSARASVTIGADDMLRLASGAAAWPQLLATGRLELGGDLFLAVRFPVLFKLPAGAA